MKIKVPGVLASAVVAFSLAQSAAYALQAPDNSAQNKNHVTTADSQSTAKTDRETTAKIRKAIVGDKGLSTYAHNIKIITIKGHVTLKGPVKSDDEKQKVTAHAASIVTADQITNQITVKQ